MGGNLDPLLAGVKRLAQDGTLLAVPAGAAMVLNAVSTLSIKYNAATGQFDLTGAAYALSNIRLFRYVDAIVNGHSGSLTQSGPGFSAVTAGVAFYPLVAGSVIVGSNFAWLSPTVGSGGSGPITVTSTLWQGGTNLATGSVLVSSTTPVVASVTFGTPYTVPASKCGDQFYISTYAPYSTGGVYCYVNLQNTIGLPSLPFIASPYWLYGNPANGTNSVNSTFGLSTTGAEAQPTSTGGITAQVAIEPVFQ